VILTDTVSSFAQASNIDFLFFHLPLKPKGLPVA